MKIKFETKAQAQQAMIELRRYVDSKTVVDIEVKENESMSGNVFNEYYIVLYNEDHE